MNKIWLYDQLYNQQSCMQIHVSEEEQDLLYDYKKLKKFILKQKKYPSSASAQVELSFIGIFEELPSMITPIVCQENLQYLMGIIESKKCEIKILLSCDHQLTAVPQIEQRGLVQFDSDGLIDEDNPNFESIMPNNQSYQGQGIVRCAFCGKSNKDKNSLKKLGAFFGPYSKNRYVHLLCAIWCSKTYFNQQGYLQNVEESLNFLKDICRYCKRKGANLQCHDPQIKCRFTIHYQCGLGKVKYNWQTYKFYCPKCALKVQGEQFEMGTQQFPGLVDENIQKLSIEENGSNIKMDCE